MKSFIESLINDNRKSNLEVEDFLTLIEQKDIALKNINSQVKSLKNEITLLNELKLSTENSFIIEVNRICNNFKNYLETEIT